MSPRLFCVLFICVGCKQQPETSPAPAPTSPPTSPPQALEVPDGEGRAGVKVRIPTSSFRAGAEPGRFTRDPQLEPRPFAAKLGAFEIDRLPYPNDPALPVALGHDAETAGRLCSERQGRLCTELEWERACRAGGQAAFSTGDAWNCPTDSACNTSEGVARLGAFAEWTASRFGPPAPKAGRLVLRGAEADEPADEHRCSRRRPAVETKGHAFRCCYGAPNGAQVPEAHEETAFDFAKLELSKLRDILRQHPNTEGFANAAEFFHEDAVETVLHRGTDDRKGFLFTTKPLLWRPSAGTEFLVVAVSAGKQGSIVAVFHTLPGDEYLLTSSFVMPGDPGPFVLAYSASIRPRLHFSSCWGCLGETGKILFREPDTAVVLQP